MRSTNNHSDLLNIKLFVLGSKDAHILLSSTDKLKSDSPLYEIGKFSAVAVSDGSIHLLIVCNSVVLGAGGNTFAEIRRRRQSSTMATVRLQKLLSSIEPLPIRIRVDQKGAIEVSVPGSNVLNLTTVDPSPFPIKYISFCTWGSTEVKFFYDCHEGDTNDKSTGRADNDAEETHLTMQLTPEDHLRTSLLSSDSMKEMYSGLTNVRLSVQLLTVSHDYRRSVLTTRAILRTVRLNICCSARLFLMCFVVEFTELDRSTVGLESRFL